MSSDGRYLSKIASKGVAEVVRSKFLQGILEAIDKRFQGDLHLFRGSSFLAFKNWPVAVDGAELGEYGDDEVSDLATTCTAQITSAGGDPDVIETEWIRFKTELHNSKRTLMRSVTWPDVWDMMEEKYPNLALLVSLLLTLPSSSVDAERGFSRMKIQKSDWRCRLGDQHLSELMLISMEGAEIGDFDPLPSIKVWEAESSRTRRPFYNDAVRPKLKAVADGEELGEKEEEGEAEAVGVEVLEKEIDEDLRDMCQSDEEEDEEEEDYHTRDMISLQQKSYKLLQSLL